MAKLVLTDPVNFQNEATAAALITANNTLIENAVENTLSRDGTSPNSMNAQLDMNSNAIINLPSPVTDTEPVRLGDITSNNGSLTVASQAEAEAGTSNARIMTPLRVEQRIDSQFVGTTTDNAIIRADGIVGHTQNSTVTVSDVGTLVGARAYPSTVGSGSGRELERHFDDILCLADFSGVTEASTSASAVDCTAGILAALTAAATAGKKLTGNGKWYGITGDLTLPDGFVWLEDFKFIQLDPNVDGRKTIYKVGGGGPITLKRGVIDRNGATDSGTVNGNSTIHLNNVGKVLLEDIEIYGHGRGQLVVIMYCDKPRVVNLWLHDAQWTNTVDPASEQLNGLRFNYCTDVTVINPIIENLTGVIGPAGYTAGARAYQCDGMDLAGCTGFTQIGGLYKNLWEGTDVSSDNINRDIGFYGVTYRDIDSHGQKFAHGVVGARSVGCRFYDCGMSSVSVSGGTGAEDEPSTGTDILISDAIAYRTGSNGNWSASSVTAFEVLKPTGGINPVNVIFNRCTAVDDNTANFTASIAATTMTVTNMADSSGLIRADQVISGSGVTVGTTVVSQLTTTAPGAVLGREGTYTVSVSQTVASTAISADGRTMKYGFRNEPGTSAAVKLFAPVVRGATVADYLGFPTKSGITTFTDAGELKHTGDIIATGTISTNTDKALSLAGNLTTSGAFATTLTFTGATGVTFPTTGTLATRAGAETLTNKTLGLSNNAAFLDGVGTPCFRLQNATDNTKQLFFDLSAIGTGNSRILSVPDAAGTVVLQSNTAALTNKTYNGLTITSTTGSLTIAAGKTLTANNTLTFTGTDSSTLNIGTGGTLRTAAYVNTGTSGATVPLLNVANTWSGKQSHNAFVAYQRDGQALTNTAGLNSNITMSKSFSILTGATGNFSVGGFTGGVDGERLIIYNPSAFQMTIVNEDASSTAANRITTLTGADVVLRTGLSSATFVYTSSTNRWLLTSYN